MVEFSSRKLLCSTITWFARVITNCMRIRIRIYGYVCMSELKGTKCQIVARSFSMLFGFNLHYACIFYICLHLRNPKWKTFYWSLLSYQFLSVVFWWWRFTWKTLAQIYSLFIKSLWIQIHLLQSAIQWASMASSFFLFSGVNSDHKMVSDMVWNGGRRCGNGEIGTLNIGGHHIYIWLKQI